MNEEFVKVTWNGKRETDKRTDVTVQAGESEIVKEQMT